MVRSTTRTLFCTLLALLLTGALLLSPQPSYADNTLNIGAARALPLGSVVTIKGTVTVASGAFVSSTFDQGFAIQDKSGGIYVSLATNVDLRLGQQAEVTGVVQDIFGLLTLVPVGPNDVEREGDGRHVQPQNVRTGSVNEGTEGKLVVVKGVISQAVASDLPYGYKFYVNDGSGEIQIFVSASTNINLSGLMLGQRVSVVGFSGQFDTTYEVQPRVQGDITIRG